MPPRKSSPPPPLPDPELSVTREEAQKRINERIERGSELSKIAIRSPKEFDSALNEYYKWNDYNNELLKRIFTNSAFADEYYRSYSFGGADSLEEKIKDLSEDFSEKIRRLESIRDRLELIPLTPDVLETHSKVAAKKQIPGNKVFIVHGQDETAKQTTARFLEKLGLETIILHEQATGGRTLIEKLEHYSEVDFAVVLLTPDDVGALKTESTNLKPRARQNVIMELGYFIAKLGRPHVCPLYVGSLDLPSDYLGVGYIPMDTHGAWKYKLGKELQAAGFQVDLNKI